MKNKAGTTVEATAKAARGVLRDMLRRGPVSFDEIGRRLGHTRGYISRALRGTNPLTLETIAGALELAGVKPAEYFEAVAKALAPPEEGDSGPSQARIEETVLRTLRKLGWSAPREDEQKKSDAPTR